MERDIDQIMGRFIEAHDNARSMNGGPLLSVRGPLLETSRNGRERLTLQVGLTQKPSPELLKTHHLPRTFLGIHVSYSFNDSFNW